MLKLLYTIRHFLFHLDYEWNRLPGTLNKRNEQPEKINTKPFCPPSLSLLLAIADFIPKTLSHYYFIKSLFFPPVKYTIYDGPAFEEPVFHEHSISSAFIATDAPTRTSKKNGRSPFSRTTITVPDCAARSPAVWRNIFRFPRTN